MFIEIVFILCVASFSYGATVNANCGNCNHESQFEYRFDYTYSQLGDGWLKLHVVPATWNEARLRCHAEGAVLASPLTENLRTAILNHVVEQKGLIPYTIFIGVHATFSKGDYFSIEGVALLRLALAWAAGEPDNANNSESCLALRTTANGSAADVSCHRVLPYVCYKKRTEIDVTECGYDKEYKMEHRTGSCYKFHARGQPWARAFMTCAAEGGHLAIINSEEEQQILKDLFSKHPDSTLVARQGGIANVGFHDWGERGTWMTIHGETLTEAGFDRFEKGQPDNATQARTGDAGEFCGSIFRSGLYNDLWCNVHAPFICEKKPDSLRACNHQLPVL